MKKGKNGVKRLPKSVYKFSFKTKASIHNFGLLYVFLVSDLVAPWLSVVRLDIDRPDALMAETLCVLFHAVQCKMGKK